MLNEAVTSTNAVFYLMIAIGVIGIIAKVVNQMTIRSMVKGAGNMSKSTHKLIKLVRSKYEHACMVNDRVENVDAFVEKYIYEYRGFLFRIHTWRQIEIQSIWFVGILAVFGAAVHYMQAGYSEEVYRYIAVGIAEMVLLFVVSQISDEHYKIEAAKNYMVDYLQNVYACRQRKNRQSERGHIDVIRTETAAQAVVKEIEGETKKESQNETEQESKKISFQEAGTPEKEDAMELPIRIEGEPRKAEKEEKEEGKIVGKILRKTIKDKTVKEEREEQPAIREEAIRQILEEFLA